MLSVFEKAVSVFGLKRRGKCHVEERLRIHRKSTIHHTRSFSLCCSGSPVTDTMWPPPLDTTWGEACPDIHYFVSEPYWNTDTAISTQSKSLSPSVTFRTWGFLPNTYSLLTFSQELCVPRSETQPYSPDLLPHWELRHFLVSLSPSEGPLPITFTLREGDSSFAVKASLHVDALSSFQGSHCLTKRLSSTAFNSPD